MNELHTRVWDALGTVLDPEIDEPITDLKFVESCTVSDDGVVQVRLRLPTFYCAPNFSFLMVADAYDAVTAVDGVTKAEIALLDHHASDEINAGVAAEAGFMQTFAGEADGELDGLRAAFLRKASLAGQEGTTLVESKALEAAPITISGHTAAVLGLVFVLILPAAVLAVGAVVVLLRRRR